MLGRCPFVDAGPPTVQLPTSIDQHVKVFRPPYEEFELQLIDIPPGTTISPTPNPGPMLLLVQKGSGTIEATAQALDAAPAGPAEGDRSSTTATAGGGAATAGATAAGGGGSGGGNGGAAAAAAGGGGGDGGGISCEGSRIEAGGGSATVGDNGLEMRLQVQRGSVVFVAAGWQLQFAAAASGGTGNDGEQQEGEEQQGMRVWAAACNASLFTK